MKKFGLFLIMLLAIFIVPFSVLAEDNENGEADVTEGESGEVAEESKEVKVYLFRGEGCPHCQEAEEWFESIEEEYGSKFEVVDYEVWYDEENSKLMDRVAKARGEDVTGVPYIIIGNHSWNGFADDLKDEILEEINSEYEKDSESRYDIMELLPDLEEENSKEKSKSTDIVVTIIIVLVVAGVTYGIIQARKKTY